MSEERKAIGIYALSNTGGLAVYEIDNTEDKVLVGLVTDEAKEPEWLDIVEKWHEDHHKYELGFMWGNWFISFSDVMRC